MSDIRQPTGTRPLAEILSDSQYLLRDPKRYLQRNELRIGPRRLPWWQILLVPAFVLLGIYLMPHLLGYAFVITGMIIPAPLAYWAWTASAEMVLRTDGVTFVQRGQAVWCPWSFFRTAGQPVLHTANLIDVEVLVPIAFAAIERVESVRNGVVVDRGKRVRSRIFRIASSDDVGILAVFELQPHELGNLLLQLGYALGSEGGLATHDDEIEVESAVPRNEETAITVDRDYPTKVANDGKSPAIDDSQTIDIQRLPTPDADGWITIPATRVLFASLCVGCCGATRDQFVFPIEEGFRWYRLLPLVGQLWPEKTLDISVPLCPRCRRRQVAWQIGTMLLVILASLTPLGILALIAFTELDLCFGLILFALAILFARLSVRIDDKPFRARYDSAARTVSLRFRDGIPTERILLF